jgi:hypothetical protein
MFYKKADNKMNSLFEKGKYIFGTVPCLIIDEWVHFLHLRLKKLYNEQFSN